MKLTEAQRWILINQYEILAALNPKDAHQRKFSDDAIEALQHGYERHYGDLAHVIPTEDAITPEQCEEVVAILNMYRAITFSFQKLADKTGMDPDDIEFDGFDGNEEGEQYAYCEWLLNSGHGKFPELNKANDCNSHRNMLGTYRRMLITWRQMNEPQQMSKEQIQALMTAKYPHR